MCDFECFGLMSDAAAARFNGSNIDILAFHGARLIYLLDDITYVKQSLSILPPLSESLITKNGFHQSRY